MQHSPVTTGGVDLAMLRTAIGVPDESSRIAALERQSLLTKPTGALGRLEDVSVWLAGVQGACPPRPLDRVRVVVFAGDHGIARSGVSAYPPEVTAQMVGNFLAGGAAVNVLARLHGAEVRVVDMAVDVDLDALPPDVTRHRVRRSSGRIDVEDALTTAETEQALLAGIAVADQEVDEGADLLVTGDMGIGNTTPAATLVAALTGAAPEDVVGRGTGIDDDAWRRKAGAVAAALDRARPVLTDPIRLLSTVGGADFAAMTGFLLGAAARRTPVLLDGVMSGACALAAAQVAPDAARWWLAGHRSTEPAHTLALAHLGLAPLLDLDLRLGEGTGALTALPVLRAAGVVLAEMATFAEAGVSNRD